MHDGSYQHLVKDCEETLRILKCDYLDTYGLHWPDPNIVIEESIDALRSLKSRGLIRDWGIGNLSEDMIARVCDLGDLRTHQAPYSWLRRNTDTYKQSLQEKRIQWWVVSPLEQGRLGTPEFRSQLTLGRHDFRNKNKYFDPVFDSDQQCFFQEAEQLQLTPTQYALIWLFNTCKVAKVIWGPRTRAQLRDGLSPIL